MSKWQKFLNMTWLILKIAGLVILGVVAGKFLWDFLGTKKKMKVHLSDLKKIKWAKHDKDPKHPVVKNPLKEDEIKKELAKLYD